MAITKQIRTVLGNIAFYVAFYGGTIPYLAWAFFAIFRDDGSFPKVVKSWSRYHYWLLHHLIGIKVVIEGPLPGPGMLVAMKHESFFEALHQPIFFDTPAVFAKDELFRIPLWGKAARAYGLIPVVRTDGAKALRAMLTAASERMKNGRILVIFPEGTRARHGTRPPLQGGFAGIYKLLKCSVVPAAVNSGPLYHRWWKRAGTITVRFSEPIAPGLPREEVEARVHTAINSLNSADHQS